MASPVTVSATPTPTNLLDSLNNGGSAGHQNQGVTIGAFLASLGTALVIFGINLVGLPYFSSPTFWR